MRDVPEILKRYERAKTNREVLGSVWREISDYVRPIKQHISASNPGIGETPNQGRLAALFDTTAIDANRTYAAGCMAWMTPSETTWFRFDAPHGLAGQDTVKRWYAQATEIAQQVLASSNFYSQIHECYLDDGAFGTCGLLCEEGPDSLLFEALQIGDYCILENEKREVDTVFRELQLSPRQAAKKFGADNLHETVRKMLESGDKDCDKRDSYLHVVMPREDRERGKVDSLNMPWASIYIDLKNKTLIRESGAWENPVSIHRHLLWSHLPYGFSPGMQALADCRQLNFMQMCLDTLVEKQVSPPVLLPANFEGSVDLRAGGYTYFKDKDSMPTFWPNPGNYMIGEDRVVFRREQINRAFHVELFQALSAVPVGKEMTAAEVHLRQRDRLTLFSPTFARKNNELNTPVMRRVFSILLRAGAFPPPPPRLVQQTPEGLPYIPDPSIVYTSRLALQIKAIQNEGYMRTMEAVGPLASVFPQMLDNLDGDKVFRGIARNEGFPEDWLASERDRDQIRQERAEAMQQAQQQQDAAMEAETAAKAAQAQAAA